MFLFLFVACDPETSDRCGTPRDEAPSTLEMELATGETGTALVERLAGAWSGVLTWVDDRVTDVTIGVTQADEPYTCSLPPGHNTDVYAPADWRLPVQVEVVTEDGGLDEALVGTLVITNGETGTWIFTEGAPLSGTAGDGSVAAFDLLLGDTTLDGNVTSAEEIATFTTERAP